MSRPCSLWVFAALYFVYVKGWRAAPAETGAVRFVLFPPEGTKFAAPYGRKAPGLQADNPADLSPDGRSLAFAVIDSSDKSAPWVRQLVSEIPLRLENTDGAAYPFWSPDSQSNGFFADGKLKSVKASGGSPRILCDATAPAGGTWNRENIILFSSAGELYRVSSSGGAVSQATRLDKARGENFHFSPRFLPDGRRFIFWASVFRAALYEPRRSAVYAGSLDTPERQLLFANRIRAVFSPPNSLIFMRDGLLLAQKLELHRLQLQGEPTAVADNINTSHGEIAFSVSDNGVLVSIPRLSNASITPARLVQARWSTVRSCR